MAISTSASILAMLKVWYRDGVENLMFRNSPVLMKINKTRVEGKTQNFSAMYGRGGAVGGDFTKAKANASTVSKSAEFEVVPGQIFSVYTMNAKEVQASVSKKGAYMKVAGAKMFSASEAFRKTMALALYGRGYGELCASGYTTAIEANTPFDLTLPMDAIMKIDIGSVLVLKTTVATSTVNAKLTVNTINGNTVNVTPDTSVASPLATDIICLDGSMEGNSPILPMGLDGWLPVMKKRNNAESAWTSYIGTKFFGVDRSIAVDRLAGAFYAEASSTAKKADSVKALIQKVRRQGSKADLIIMNDEDFLSFTNELETTNTFFTQTSTKGKKKATVGFDEVSASFSTNYVDNIYDDPYCPKGRFYVLDTTAVEFWSYTNTDKLNDGIVGNESGKQDPMTMENEGAENKPYGLIIDDYLNVAPGADGVDGPSVAVTLQCFGSFVVINPSICGVGEFYGSTDFACA